MHPGKLVRLAKVTLYSAQVEPFQSSHLPENNLEIRRMDNGQNKKCAKK
jgi:hypothetical protein